MTGKRSCLTLHEKLWIIKKKAENENMKHTQLAVAFEAHFKRPISRQRPISRNVLRWGPWGSAKLYRVNVV